MGYTGQKMSDLTGAAKDAVDPAIRSMVDEGSKRLQRRVQENTPVSEPQRPLRGRPQAPPGTLRESITIKETRKVGDVWEGGVYTEVIYAPFVEEGTGLWGPNHTKYRIEPKDPNGVLAFFTTARTPEGRAMHLGTTYNTTEGTLVFAKYVMHPGSPGQHMFAIGASMVEAEMEDITREGANEWKKRTEAAV